MASDFLPNRLRRAGGILQRLALILFCLTLAAPAFAGPSGSTSRKSPTATSKTDADSGAAKPQVELYIPSFARLVESSRKSNTSQIAGSLAGLVTLEHQQNEEEFDIRAVLKLLATMADWPDTSVSLSTYTQDREGRPRWAVRVDWPLGQLVKRVRTLMDLEETKKVLKDIELREHKAGRWSIELPEVVLAVLLAADHGSVIASTADLDLPEMAFGQKKSGGPDRASASLIYCRLNLKAGSDKERGGGGLFGQLSGIDDIRYSGAVDEAGEWKERFNIRWSPAMGLFVKQALKKVKATFDCPREALLSGTVNIELGQSLADSIAGLPPMTIGGRAGTEMCVAVAPGDGFLPIPDVFYQFKSRAHVAIVKSIREAIAEDTARRREDDRPAAWHELTIEDEPVFWKDPAADDPGGYRPLTFRTVIFMDRVEVDGEEAKKRLIITETAGWADDVVRRWKQLRTGAKSVRTIPTDKKSSWEFLINWKDVYALVQPYLALTAAVGEDTTPPASAEELADQLSDSIVSVRIEYAGLDVRHRGPLPLGVAFVPTVVYASLSATPEWGSEAEREQVACRNLRVLHHHAGLFKKDYGRWPANVAELDGYVDFQSHPQLLMLREQDRGFAGNILSVFSRRDAKVRSEAGEEVIDDSLYEMDWSADDWKLRFKPNQFKEYATIYIDTEGEIHRVPKPGTTSDKHAG